MDNLHWPLAVLCKAVHFKNLTGASAHVGLSQPQLSRIISQLENELSVKLLDRSAKRKSSWTPAAFRLAEVYSQNARRLQSSLHEVLDNQAPTHITIGTLEGLSPSALSTAHSLMTKTKVLSVELDVYDQNDLEEKFFNGDLDLMFTSRLPSKQKLTHVHDLGYQAFEHVASNATYHVLSPYEFGRLKKKPDSKLFISNSLSLRRLWFDNFGGIGDLPSAVQKAKGRDLTPVLIIAAEMFNDSLWQHIQENAQIKV